MRYIKIFFMGLALLLAAIEACAAPVGNISTPSMLKKSGLMAQEEPAAFSFIGNGEFDFTRDRKLKNESKDAELRFYGAKAGVVVANRVFLYGIVGAAEAVQEFNISGAKVKWDTDYDVMWGGGATAILYEQKFEQLGNGIFRLGADARFRTGDLDLTKVAVNGTEYTMPNSAVTEKDFEINELQVALAVSYQVDRFLPYFGVKFSSVTGDAKATIDYTQYKVDLESDDNIGIFVGGDILITESLSVNAEARFIDETAITAGATLRF